MAEILAIFCCIFGTSKTPQICSEIIWPLVRKLFMFSLHKLIWKLYEVLKVNYCRKYGISYFCHFHLNLFLWFVWDLLGFVWFFIRFLLKGHGSLWGSLVIFGYWLHIIPKFFKNWSNFVSFLRQSLGIWIQTGVLHIYVDFAGQTWW